MTPSRNPTRTTTTRVETRTTVAADASGVLVRSITRTKTVSTAYTPGEDKPRPPPINLLFPFNKDFKFDFTVPLDASKAARKELAAGPPSNVTIDQLPLLVTEKILLFLDPLDMCDGNLLDFVITLPVNFRYWLVTDSHFARHHLAGPSAAGFISAFSSPKSKEAWSQVTHTYKMAIYHAIYSDCDKLQSHVREMVLSLPPPHTPHNNAMFFEACSHGHLYVFNTLLSEDSVSPDFLIHGLNSASNLGHSRIVKTLLQRIDDPYFTVAENAMVQAYSGSRLNVAEAILSCTPALSTTQTVRELMMTACRQNRIDFLELFLSVSDASNECMMEACQIGHHGVVEALLKHSSIDPNLESSKFLCSAAENHHYLVVSILLRDQRSNPDEATLSEVLIILCKAVDRPDSSDLGHLRAGSEKKEAKAGAVELILARPGNHPTAKNNEALRLAALNNSPTILDLLLSDPRIPTIPKHISALFHVLRISPLKSFEKDARIRVEEYVQQISTDQLKQCLPFVMQNKAVSESCILAAVGLKNDALLGLLLEVPGVDPASSDNAALEKALRMDHMTAFSILLDKMIAPPVRITSLAVDLFKLSAVQMLVDSPHLRWGADVLEEPVINAAKRGYIDILRLLLAHAKTHKIDFNLNTALLQSCKEGSLVVVNELLKESNIDPNCESSGPLRNACTLNHADIVKALLEDGRAKPDAHMLVTAVNMDHQRVVAFLVADERTPIESNAIVGAAQLGRKEIMGAILNSPFLSSEVWLACSKRAIADATSLRHGEILDLLKTKRNDALKLMNETPDEVIGDSNGEPDAGNGLNNPKHNSKIQRQDSSDQTVPSVEDTPTITIAQDEAGQVQSMFDSPKSPPTPDPAFSFHMGSSSPLSVKADSRHARKSNDRRLTRAGKRID
ncbi:hypothetical protein HDU80_007329 [Chytriomyces hyalinus]|nr:hypothetical protein HDU80_007329 [Chytriomyces hyalinus]